MKNRKIILVLVVLGAIICAVAISIFFKSEGGSEEERLISRARKAQKKLSQSNANNSGIARRFLVNFFFRPNTEYWTKEYRKTESELINKGYFKRGEITLNEKQKNKAYMMLLNDEEFSKKFLTASFHPKGPNDSNVILTFIGSIEDVDLQIKMFKETFDSNESEIITQ